MEPTRWNDCGKMSKNAVADRVGATGRDFKNSRVGCRNPHMRKHFVQDNKIVSRVTTKEKHPRTTGTRHLSSIAQVRDTEPLRQVVFHTINGKSKTVQGENPVGTVLTRDGKKA